MIQPQAAVPQITFLPCTASSIYPSRACSFLTDNKSSLGAPRCARCARIRSIPKDLRGPRHVLANRHAEGAAALAGAAADTFARVVVQDRARRASAPSHSQGYHFPQWSPILHGIAVVDHAHVEIVRAQKRHHFLKTGLHFSPVLPSSRYSMDHFPFPLLYAGFSTTLTIPFFHRMRAHRMESGIMISSR